MNFEPNWWQVNTGSGHGLVPPGIKPLAKPMFTQTDPGPQIASLSHNELIDELILIFKKYFTSCAITDDLFDSLFYISQDLAMQCINAVTRFIIIT